MKETKAIDKTTIGGRIKAARKALGMTQEELAEIMCIPKSTISAYENDKVDIKASIIVELSNYLHTSPNYLLGYENTEDKDPDIESVVDVLKSIKDEKMKQLLFMQIQAVKKIDE